MDSTIRIAYIPNTNTQRNIMESIEETLDAWRGPIPTEMSLLINSSIGINMSPNSLNYTSINECISYINEKNLIKVIENDIKIGKSIIMLNGYDIDIDYIKNNLYPLIKNGNILLSINILTEDEDLKFPSYHQYVIKQNIKEEPDDIHWNEIKKDIEKKYEEDKKNSLQLHSINLNNSDTLSILLNILSNSKTNIDKNENELLPNNLSPIFNIVNSNKNKKHSTEYIVESISFSNEECFIQIDKYKNGDIVLSDELNNEVLLTDKALDFLFLNLK